MLHTPQGRFRAMPGLLDLQARLPARHDRVADFGEQERSGQIYAAFTGMSAGLVLESRPLPILESVEARLTALTSRTYGAAFRSHTGRWDPLPVEGTREEAIQTVVDLLGPYLTPENY